MARTAVVVSIDLHQKVIPLVGGYLHASAWADPELRRNWHIEKCVYTNRVSAGELAADLIARDADVYAFSCYVWNTRLVKKVLPFLFQVNPDVQVILGGPQVMHCAARYLSPRTPNLVLCNGEGELTFRNYLRQLDCERPDFSGVRGLSFYRDRTLITTEDEPRIEDLDSIPSPYLNGYINTGEYRFAHLETNRGCPFKCEYCYWGGAIGARVHKMSTERVAADITWIARNQTLHVFIVDANWGMLERDVDLSRHFALCRQEHGYPREVTFCSAKNSPERVGRITRIFHEAGLLAAPSIAIQSLSDAALAKVGRSNIRLNAYERLQRDLGLLDMTTFAELIWPLPGETLASFRSGIERLCANRADCVMVYPLLLMNNVELDAKKEQYGLVTEQTNDQSSEEEVVVQTAEVSPRDYEEGWRLIFATILLYNLRGLYGLAHYLHQSGIRRYADLFDDFTAFIASPDSSPAARDVDRLRRTSFELRTTVTESFGRIVHAACHEDRDLVDTCLFQFASSQSWWADERARAYFEADLLNRVYVYLNTKKRPKTVPFRELRVRAANTRGYVVEVPDELRDGLKEVFAPRATFTAGAVQVDHHQKQAPLGMVRPGTFEQWGYCAHKMVTIRETIPIWHDAEVPGAVPKPWAEITTAIS